MSARILVSALMAIGVAASVLAPAGAAHASTLGLTNDEVLQEGLTELPVLMSGLSGSAAGFVVDQGVYGSTFLPSASVGGSARPLEEPGWVLRGDLLQRSSPDGQPPVVSFEDVRTGVSGEVAAEGYVVGFTPVGFFDVVYGEEPGCDLVDVRSGTRTRLDPPGGASWFANGPCPVAGETRLLTSVPVAPGDPDAGQSLMAATYDEPHAWEARHTEPGAVQVTPVFEGNGALLWSTRAMQPGGGSEALWRLDDSDAVPRYVTDVQQGVGWPVAVADRYATYVMVGDTTLRRVDTFGTTTDFSVASYPRALATDGQRTAFLRGGAVNVAGVWVVERYWDPRLLLGSEREPTRASAIDVEGGSVHWISDYDGGPTGERSLWSRSVTAAGTRLELGATALIRRGATGPGLSVSDGRSAYLDPDNRLVIRDRDGTERVVAESDGGAAFPQLSGSRLLFELYSPDEPGRQWRLFDLATGITRVLSTEATDGDRRYTIDGDMLAWSLGDGSVWTQNLASGGTATRQVAPNPAYNGYPPQVLVSGRWLAWSDPVSPGSAATRWLDLTDGTRRQTPGFPYALSDRLVAVEDYETFSLVLVDLEGGTRLPVPGSERFQSAAVSAGTAGWIDRNGRPHAVALRGPTFSDVSETNQFFTEIEWMASSGISTGWPDGTFRPLQPVNRDAMAAFLYRQAGSPGFVPPPTASFADVPVGTQFYKEIEWMKATGVSTGWPDRTYRPSESVKRDAMAAFLFRFKDL